MKKHLLSIVAFIALSFFCIKAKAATYTWAAGTTAGAVWTTPTNWSPATGYPGKAANDVAVINTAGANIAFTTATAKTIGTITIGNSATVSLNISTGLTLTVNTLNIGTTNGTSVTTLTLTGPGTMTANGNANINLTASLIASAGNLNLNGAVNLNGIGTNTTNGSFLTVNGTGTITASNTSINYDGGYDYVTAASGTLNINNTDVFLGEGYDNYVQNNFGFAVSTAYQYNYFNVSGGTVTASNSEFIYYGNNDYISTSSGALNLTNNSVVAVGYGFYNYIQNDYPFNPASFLGSSAYEYDYFNVSGGTVTATGSDIDDYGYFNYMSISGGMFNLNASSTVALGYGFSGADNNQINVLTGGTFAINGTAGAETSTNVYIGYSGTGGTNSTTCAFTNTGGAVNVTSGEIIAYNGPLTNTSGTFTGSDAVLHMDIESSFPAITNAGTFTLNAASQLDFYYPNTTLTNTGTFNVNGSTVNFGLTAALNFGNGTNFTPTACTLNNTAGSFNLGPLSTMNFNVTSSNSTATASTVNNSSSGIFTCASTSIINFVQPYAIINQTSSNPFTLLSDASGSATVGAMPYTTDAMTATTASAKYNVQRYISTASHGYRMLASAVNVTNKTNPAIGSTSTTAPNLVDLSALGRDVTVPGPYYGAFVGGYLGTTGGFTNTTPGPCLYLNQESIIPNPLTEDQSYTGGKNVAVINIKNSNLSGSYTISTANSNTIAMGAVAADNGTTVQVPVGNGYQLYYIHNDLNQNVAGTLDASATTATGYINQGSIPVFLFNTQGSSFSGVLTKNGSAAASALSGYNLVGNPYPASIDLKKVYTDNTGTVFTAATATFTELNPTNEQFVQYQSNGGTSGLNASEYVASGEGFYALVANAGTFTFKEDQKVSSATGPTVVMESFPVAGNPAATLDHIPVTNKITDVVVAQNFNAPASLTIAHYAANNINPGGTHTAIIPNHATNGERLSPAVKTPESIISANNNVPSPAAAPVVTPPAATASKLVGLHLKLVQDSVNYDECGVYFDKKWSDNFDINDARDLDGNAGKVFLSSYSADDVRTGINSLGDYKGGKRVKLYAGFSASGLYQLQMEDIFNFNTNKYSVFLIDNLLKDSLDLTLYKSYNFNYTSGTANDSTRFVLAIEHKPVPHYALLAFAGAKVTEGVKLNWTTLNEANYTTFVLQKLNAGNTYAFLDSLQSDSAGAYSYVDQHPVLGSNTYRLQQTDGLGNITYSSPVTIGYNSTTPNGGLTIYPNPSKAMITVTLATGSTATAVATADIYNSSGVLVEHKVVNSNSFTHDISAYNLGVYIIQLKNSNGIIVGNSKFVKVQ